MVAAGVGAVPIVALTAFCSGPILAFQGGSELRKIGALELVIGLVAIGITREAGPLITAITGIEQVLDSVEVEKERVAATASEKRVGA